MKAAWFDAFGNAQDVLTVGEKPDPVPAAGDVLVRLKTSGVNPSDVKKRAGSFPDLLDDGPVIPHSDGAGVIEAVGASVPEARIGERVWIYQAQYGRKFGTAAEYIAIDATRAIPLPDETGFDVGACLGIPAMTAHRCVFADGPVDGNLLLVTGGAGRVGHYAIQWASRAGAIVVATASNSDDEAACRAAGARHVVNHRDDDWHQAVLDATGGRKIDRAIDVEFGANLPQVLEMMRSSGTIATYSSTQVAEPSLPFFRMMYLDLTVRLIIVYAMPETAKTAAIADIGQALERDELLHRVAGRYPLDDVAAAHEAVEEGKVRGSVIVDID